MSGRSRMVLVLAATAGSIVFCSTAAPAQLIGRHSPGAEFAPVDASALGVTHPANVGFFLAGEGIVAGGGLGARGGAVRGYLAGGPLHWALGAAFARTFARRRLDGPIWTTAGGELVGGYRHRFRRFSSDGGALHLTVPLGLSVGDPDGPSVSLYAAPYAETGIVQRWTLGPGGCLDTPCEYVRSGLSLLHALGVGVGTRISLGRFSAVAIVRDLPVRRYRSFAEEIAALGLTYRLGQ